MVIRSKIFSQLLVLAGLFLIAADRSADAADLAKRPVVTLSPSANDSGAIQAAWYAGNDVMLSPGVYHLNEYIHRPAHASLHGANENLVVLVPGGIVDALDGSEAAPPAMRENGAAIDGGSITDLTFDSTSAPGTNLYSEHVPEPGLIFQNLKIIEGNGPNCESAGATWNNIEFIHGSMASNSDGVKYSNISFYGPPRPGANECLLGGNNVSFQHGLWRNTQRGMVIRWPMDHASFFDLDFEDVCARPQNANEVILLESSGPLSHSTFDTVQMHNCRGPALALDFGGAVDNTFIRFEIDDNGGAHFGFNRTMGANSTGNHFTQWEMRNSMNFEFNSSKGNVVDNFAVVNPRPGWGGQFYFSPDFYSAVAVFSHAYGNFIDYPKSVRVIGLPERWSIGAGGQ